MKSSVNSVSRINPEVHLLLLLAFFYGFMSIYMPRGGGDVNFWSDWAIYIKEHGIRHIYNLHTRPVPGREPSFLYGPVYMYLLYFFGKWQGAVELIQYNVHKLKIITLAFDIVGIWFALRFVRDKVNLPFYALFFIFNLGLLYDTISWSQIDGIITCLALVAVYFAMRDQLALSGISFIAALLIKPQPVMFLPVLAVLWLTSVLKKPLRYTVLSLLGIALVVVILLWPFLQAGTFVDYWAMLGDSPNTYPVVTVNAGNVWSLLLTQNPNTVSDAFVWAGLSYKQWGLLMFGGGYGLILFPLLRQFYQIVRGSRTHYDNSLVLLVVGLVPIVFYFFNTQMHERYAHPCVLLLGAYALSKADFIPYIVASLANFLVMDKFMRMFDLGSLYDYVSLELVAVLFLFVLIWGVVRVYRKSALVERAMAPA